MTRRRHGTAAPRAALGAAVVLLWLAASPAAAAETRSALLIHGGARLVPAAATMDQTLRATIAARAPSPVQFYTEYLDLTWFPGEHERHIEAALREKYARVRFDVVVVCGEPALRFALRTRRTLFPRTPLVFCGVEDAAVETMRLPPEASGVTMFRDWTAALDLIQRLHPDTRRIVVVGGTGAVERHWESLARKALAPYEGRLAFTYLSGPPIGEVVAAVGAVEPGSVILFNAFLRDGAGRTFSSAEALDLLAPAARVPIYGFSETQVGHGIVGGVLVSYEAQARRAAELAVRVLAGERLGPADVVHRLPGAYVFDARQLERWSISESRLPAGSVVMFREPSFWSRYKWPALGAAVLGSVQALLVLGLLAGRRRSRRAQRRLDERLRFEVLLADLAAGFVGVPARDIDERVQRGLDAIVEEMDLDRAGLAELTAAGDPLRVTHMRTRDGVSLPPGTFTHEGWPWILDRLRAGDTVCFTRLADLPGAAVIDRQSFLRLGTKSLVMVPVMVGGSVIAGLACSMVRRERQWPDDLVRRLRLLADIFAVVLMRRRADRALEESEDRFHVMADTAPVPMWVAGPEGRCIAFNRAWLDFTGRALSAEWGDGWLDGVHPDDREACRQTCLAALTARRPFTLEFRLRRADGEYRAVLDTGVPRFDRDGVYRGYVGTVVDVTEVKTAQHALVESLALRSAILGSLYGRVAALDRTGVIIAVNEAWTHELQEHATGGPAAGVGANYLEVCRRAAASGDADARAALQAVEDVLAGRTTRALLEYAAPGAEGVRWYAMIVEVLKRPEGGLVISHLDVTRRRRAEEQVQREREELAHALRVATLGELATSLAHEINQPLAAIATNAHAARRSLGAAPGDPEIPEMLGDIAADAERAAQIIRRLRVLFKKEHGEQQPVDVGDVVKEVIALLHKDLERRGVRLEVALQPGAPRVVGDIVQLQQVILNVLVNAAEAMTGEAAGGELRIETRARESGILAITVRDSGHGVPQTELEHIFDRFVTSKPEGLGMGLSISRSIVEAHGGRIWATRNPDRGLTLSIELPCLEG